MDPFRFGDLEKGGDLYSCCDGHVDWLLCSAECLILQIPDALLAQRQGHEEARVIVLFLQDLYRLNQGTPKLPRP
eukprot:5725386-Amphidinium_carterae.1